MNKRIIFIYCIAPGLFYSCQPECKDVTDIDGNTYKTVCIGTQCWMAENLKVTRYRNGDPIPNITNDTTWQNLSSGAYCDYNNNPANSVTYGRLYNWYAINDSRNIAPAGWHIPTKTEWETLENYLSNNIGYRLKVPPGHAPPWDGGNTCGFSAIGAGSRYCSATTNEFFGLDSITYYWSGNENNSTHAYLMSLVSYDPQSYLTLAYKESGCSIRCIKD